MSDTVGRILFDSNGNAIKVTQDGADYKYEFLGKLRNAAGTIVNPATQDTLSSVDSWLELVDGGLDAIRGTDGIKKITDQLPAGTNEIGKVAQGTRAIATGAWPFYVCDSAGNIVGVVQDDTVYRLQMAGKITVDDDSEDLVHLRSFPTTGALKATLVSGGGDIISFPGIASDPSGIVNDFARQSGGTDDADLTVDGSSTPVDFTFGALGSGEADLAVQSIEFVMVANSIASGAGNFAGLSYLTTGVQIFSKEGTTYTQIGLLQENEDFMHFASAGGYGFWALSKDQVQSQFFVSGSVVLHAGQADAIVVRINEDLGGINYFKCFIKAVKRG